jgi:hypothetical protein
MNAGDVTLDGFKDWDTAPNEVLERVEREWVALGRAPNLGEICWLSNTEAGDKRARGLGDNKNTI